MDEVVRKVSKILREIRKDMGGAIPIDDILNRTSANNISKDQTMAAIERLQSDGLVSRIDDDAIEFL